MTGLTPQTIGLFAFVAITQIIAVGTLQRTEGFTNLHWTATCLGIYAVSYWGLAAMLRSGAPLGVLIPVLSAVIPLCAIGIAVVFQGETLSLAKISTLGCACLLVGVASTLK